MVSICFYFQVHQPFRLAKYTIFDIGKHQNYFADERNIHEVTKIAKKCYLPTNNLMLNLLKKHPEFRISYSFSNVVLEQFEKYAPDVLESFQRLTDTGQVEILEETSHHSLSFLYSKSEFFEQIALHRKKIKELFSQTPRVFRNTELIYSNEIARDIESLGYKGMLMEGADHVLGWRSPNFIYSPNNSKLKLLLKNYKLSDDIAFRFSNKGWTNWPLTAPKFSNWLSAANGNGNIVNLFMDYETFGEHQWEDTGIFSFLEHLPGELMKHPDNEFITPTKACEKYNPVAQLDVPNYVSWADLERDISAWRGNKMQEAALHLVYSFENKIKELNDPNLLEMWRKLTTSDHFYYMCTKWFSDGDVHKYFNPHQSPYEAYMTFMNVLHDLKERIPIVVPAR